MKIKNISVQNMNRQGTNKCSIILLQTANSHSTKRRAHMTPALKEQLHIDDAPDDDFIKFLRFCADRLNKDEPVQAIWLAWKELTSQK